MQPWLDNKHTIFGRAISGLDVINQAPVAGGGAATDLIDDANEIVANLNGTTAP